MLPLLRTVSLTTVLSKYNPSYLNGKDGQSEALRNTPTLRLFEITHGREGMLSWLKIQIADLNEFCGKRIVLSHEQIEGLANQIADLCPVMTITELLLFFKNFKQAKYGVFFGSIDPMVIMSGLTTYKKELRDMWIREHDRREKEERDNRINSGISYQEYLKQKNNGTYGITKQENSGTPDERKETDKP